MGTAMGTPMAPNYANIFMTKFETDLIESYYQSKGVRPLVWFRYIDDIFFIWSEGPEKLSDFIKYAQTFSESTNMKSKIKFEVNQSTEIVNFLDVTIKIQRGLLVTSLYSKPTDAHMYLNTSSNHPKHVIRNIPKGQFIRIRRICSDMNDYKSNSNILSEFLVKRGYDRKALTGVINDVARIKREDLLLNNQKVEKDPQTIFVTEWHPSLSRLSSILKKHFHLLESDQELAKVFPKPPSVAFRRPKSLRKHLVYTQHSPTSKDEAGTCTLSCGRCKICKALASSKEISNPKVKNTTQKITDCGTCSSRNLIYAVRCKKCKTFYIGQTGEKLQDRMSKHRYDIRKRPENSELAEHFHLNHDLNEPEKYMEVFILQTGLLSEAEREHFEDRWICRLQALQPTGMNKEMHSYGIAMYNSFKLTT